MRNKRLILILATVTLIGFSAIGFVLVEFVEKKPWLSSFESDTNIFLEILIGTVFGILAALLAWKLIVSKLMNPVRGKYSNVVGALRLKPLEIVYVSFCAGFGEEILFRAGVQPILGIWITSVLFVALHGYLNPKDWRTSIYGVYMTLVIAGVGYAFEYVGLVTAIVAHMWIDIVLFYLLSSNKKDETTNFIELEETDVVEQEE